MASMVDKNAQLVPIGTLLGGRYRVLRQLGQGGMGAVFEAENTWTKRRVAVKVMRPEIAAHAEYARRFMQEAQAATQLAHPNIVDVLDMGEDMELGSLYIVQEFLTGHDLRRHLDAAGRMPVRDVLGLILPIMDALATAHACGVVHRDIKPDNIFLAETPRGLAPKLIDFGIAKVAAQDGTSLQQTSMGALMGTPHYMSPEQALGDAGLDARTDVWAIAVVLYEMLSGARPHESSTNANALIAKIIYEDPKPLAEAAPDLPTDLVMAVMGALRRDLTKRHATMQRFIDALRACNIAQQGSFTTPLPRANLPAGAHTPPPRHADTRVEPSPAGSETFAPRVETLPTDAMIRAARRRRAGLVALGSTLVVSLAAALGALSRPVRVAHPTASHALPVTPAAAPVTPVAPAAPSTPLPQAPQVEPVAAATPVLAPVVRPSNDLSRGAARPTRLGRRSAPRAAEAPERTDAPTPPATALSTSIPLPPPR